MSRWFPKTSVNSMAVILAAIALTFILSTQVRAQQTRSLPENVPQQGDPDRQVRAQEIEAERAARDPQMVMAEINEDFEHLRALSEEMKTALNATPAPDYKHVSDSSAEVKKRATRLKGNLNFPPPPKDDKQQRLQDPGNEFRPLLAAVDRVLRSFLTNPVFSDTGGLDPQLANKAKLDLDDIIKFSEKLRKSAEKMSKNAGKS